MYNPTTRGELASEHRSRHQHSARRKPTGTTGNGSRAASRGQGTDDSDHTLVACRHGHTLHEHRHHITRNSDSETPCDHESHTSHAHTHHNRGTARGRRRECDGLLGRHTRRRTQCRAPHLTRRRTRRRTRRHTTRRTCCHTSRRRDPTDRGGNRRPNVGRRRG